MKRRIIRAAETPAKPDTETIIDERIDAVSDDFDYIMAGVEKLGRMGGTKADAAVSILGRMAESLQEFIGQVADELQ